MAVDAREAMERLNAEAAPLHIWLRTQANAPAQRPWFRETGLDAGGQVAARPGGRGPAQACRRIAGAGAKSAPYLDRIAEIAAQCRGLADRVRRAPAVPADQSGARRAPAGDQHDALRGVDL